MTSKPTADTEKGKGRKPYCSPQLREYGSLRELVLGKSGGNLPDIGNNTKFNAGQ